jgi:predicted CoA-substrate-specific enzyme activase
MSMLVAGIDVGSLSTDAVILDDARRVLGYSIVATGASAKRASERALAEALAAAGATADEVTFTLATGYGREIVPFANAQVTEITCHARGAHFLNPAIRTILDIGGQDSKAIRVGERGKVVNFAMNDKCAAGTGRFLEVMARALEVDLEDMGPLSLRSTVQVTVSSMCTVFAESEVVSLIAAGHAKEDILSGIHRAICDRVSSLLERVGIDDMLAMSGGVAKNVGVVAAIEQRLGRRLYIAPEPQIIGALGAALIGLDKALAAAA